MRQIGDNEYESILRVSNVNPSFYGEFVCKAGNNMGSVQTVVNLVKKGRPESPSNLESTDTGPNSIVMSWVENFNGGLNNTMFKLQYRELGGSISDAKEIGCRTKVGFTLISIGHLLKNFILDSYSREQWPNFLNLKSKHLLNFPVEPTMKR